MDHSKDKAIQHFEDKREKEEMKKIEDRPKKARTGPSTLTIGVVVKLINYFKQQDLESRAVS